MLCKLRSSEAFILNGHKDGTNKNFFQDILKKHDIGIKLKN